VIDSRVCLGALFCFALLLLISAYISGRVAMAEEDEEMMNPDDMFKMGGESDEAYSAEGEDDSYFGNTYFDDYDEGEFGEDEYGALYDYDGSR